MLPDTPRTDCLACGAYGNGWCLSGEIDIMEHKNKEDMLYSTAHYGGLTSASWQDCRYTEGGPGLQGARRKAHPAAAAYA